MEKKMNEKILRTYFSGLHGLVPSKPTSSKPLTGKVSDSKLVGKSK